MLFKGTTTRSAQVIAQTIDSIGGQLDAFTAKEYAGYYIKVLDEHLPLAIDLLSRSGHASGVRARRTSSANRASSSKRSRWSRMRPTIWSTRCSRSSSGRATRSAVRFSARRRRSGPSTSPRLREYFERTYLAPNLVIAAAGHLDHAQLRDLVERAFADLPSAGRRPTTTRPPVVTPGLVVRQKDIEQSHVCLGTPAYPQAHADRHALVRAEHDSRRLDELAAVPAHP